MIALIYTRVAVHVYIALEFSLTSKSPLPGAGSQCKIYLFGDFKTAKGYLGTCICLPRHSMHMWRETAEKLMRYG